jgi:hypothetical protein
MQKTCWSLQLWTKLYAKFITNVFFRSTTRHQRIPTWFSFHWSRHSRWVEGARPSKLQLRFTIQIDSEEGGVYISKAELHFSAMVVFLFGSRQLMSARLPCRRRLGDPRWAPYVRRRPRFGASRSPSNRGGSEDEQCCGALQAEFWFAIVQWSWLSPPAPSRSDSRSHARSCSLRWCGLRFHLLAHTPHTVPHTVHPLECSCVLVMFFTVSSPGLVAKRRTSP